MNRIAFATVAGALVSLAALGASAANAQTFGHVSVNIGLPLPSLPVAVVRPAPVMVHQPVQRAWAPAPAYYGHGHDRHDRYDRRGYQNVRWDRDGDGVPNRYDRRPMDPYRR